MSLGAVICRFLKTSKEASIVQHKFQTIEFIGCFIFDFRYAILNIVISFGAIVQMTLYSSLQGVQTVVVFNMCETK